MPNTSSAKKALRGSIKKNQINRLVKTKLRQAIKKAQADNMPATFSMIDKAAKANIIHPNKAARIKSRISRIVGTKGAAKIVNTKATSAAKKKAVVKKSIAKKTTKRAIKK